MSRCIHSLFILFIILAACEDDERIQSPPSPLKGTIGFSVNTLQTRGTPIMQLLEVTDFRVIAYQHPGLWSDVSSLSAATLFMNHISVSQNADGSWNYSPVKYWPKNENITFFSYAPEATPGNTPNQSGLSVSTPIDGSSPVITYQVPSSVENQPDLLVSTSQNYNLNSTNNGNSSVNVALAHALTCIGFKSTGNGEHITKIELSGVVGEGSISLGNSSVNWNIDPANTNYTFQAGVNGETLDTLASSTLNENGYLMMIPQKLTDQTKLTITVDGGETSYIQTFNLNVSGNEEWLPGQFVEYEFAVLPTGTIILNPESIVLPWQEQSYSSFTIICPEQNPNAVWKVDAPLDGWLHITDTLSKINIESQIGSYNYSGQGSKILYAYAPAANTTTAELLSVITLEGSLQQVAVTQLYQDEIYIPTYPHDGWAGSNIYWVEDNTYPAGGYLTFDNKDETTHEKYQGVYFMWGSLVALSPKGNTWNGGVWNNGGGQILYIPNPDPATNGGWNPSTNSMWGYIPRMGWTNNSNPNGGGSAINISTNDQQSYLIQNHNPMKNIGDICKFITDMGWAPGAEVGRKWRMPTHLEYLQMTDYNKVGANFTYQESLNEFGHTEYENGFRRESGIGTPFFPTSGYRINYIFVPNGGVDNQIGFRPGEAFSYWTSSPRALNGDAFDYIGVNPSPTNTQGFSRDSGNTIRCVMENH